MARGGRWFRVNTTWSQSEWIACLAPAARLAWIELLGYVKAHGYDGKVRSVSTQVFARMVGIDPVDITAMLEAAVADDALTHADGEWIICGWKEHQGDPTGRDRVERHRQKKADSNGGNALQPFVTPTETETETSTETKTDTSVISLSARDSIEDAATKIMRLANRGMIDNPSIDHFIPINDGHGSRQDVIDWLLSGVPAALAGDVVYKRSRDWTPSARRRQIDTLKYFTNAVLEAFDHFQAAQTTVPNGNHDRGAGRETPAAAPTGRKTGGKFDHLVQYGDHEPDRAAG